MTGVTGKECAAALGISQPRLVALFNESRIPRNADKSWDIEAVRAAFINSTDPAHPSKIDKQLDLPGADAGFHEIRTEVLRVKLRQDQIDLKQREGGIIDRVETLADVGGMVVDAKGMLMGMANKLAPQLAVESDPVMCQSLIEDEIHSILKALTEWEPKAA